MLYLEGNELTFLSGLEGLDHLEELCLDKNRIKHLDGTAFSSLSSLRQLRVEENGLRTFSNMQYLTNLRTLHCGYNRITEMGELDELAEIPQLRDLNLCHNSVSRKPFYRVEFLKKIPTLCTIGGKDISPEERNRAMYDGEPSDIGEHLGSLVGASGGSLVSVLSIGLPESSNNKHFSSSLPATSTSTKTNNFSLRKNSGSGGFIPKSSTKIREIIHRSRLMRDAPTKISSVSSMRARHHHYASKTMNSSGVARGQRKKNSSMIPPRGGRNNAKVQKGRWQQKLSTRAGRNF